MTVRLAVLAAAALFTAPVLAAGTSAASGVPAQSMNLQGATNARDVGGYPTVDGHTVRTGLVFRSNSLSQLSDADLATLQNHNVRVIVDLRTLVERTLQPDRVPAGAADYSRDVLGQAPITSFTDPASAYPAFITAPGANHAFAATLRDIISTNGAVLYHCTSGKDRTGWTSAVLLTILGVDRATVNQDFLLSDARLGAPAGDTFRGVTLNELDAAFNTVQAQYGSFDNYVHRGLGLTDADTAALKAKLLA